MPVIQANVSGSIMGPSGAAIHIPATDEVHSILPRSVVHLFYYDSSDSAEARDLRSKSTYSEAKTDPKMWKLLFTGEVLGYQYVKADRGRQAVLQCSDFTNYWESAKLYYGNKKTTHRQVRQNIFMGHVQANRGSRKIDSSNDLIRLLHTRPSTQPTLQGLLGGVVHLLESITGVYNKRAARTHRGVSDFFSQAELRLKLTKQIGIAPGDLTSKYFTGSKEFRKYIRRMSRQFRNTSSYSKLVNVLLSRVHHVRYPVLAPPYLESGTKVKYLKLVPAGNGTTKTSVGYDEELSGAEKALRTALKSRHDKVKSRIVRDQWQYTKDPSVPDDEANQVIDVDGQSEWKYKYEPTLTKGAELDRIKRDIEEIPVNGTEGPDGNIVKDGIDKKEKTRLLTKADNLKRATAVVTGKLMEESEYKGAEQYTVGQDGTELWFPYHTRENKDLALRHLGAANTKPKMKYSTVERELTLGDRLITVGMSPNLWFCPPPKCNVIFPDRYYSYTVGRNWLNEPTRLWLFGLRSSGRMNWGQTYFAPNTDIINGPPKKDMARAAAQSISFLMEHEKFTGIVPVMTGIGDVNALTKMNKVVEKADGSKPLSSFRAKNPALAKAAHAKFFEARFAGRTISVNAVFSPNLLVGLPALVLDPVTESSLESRPVSRGKHYLGLITSVTHQVSQNSRPVSLINMSYARRHDEGLDIFKGDPDDQGKITVTKEFTRGHGKKVLANGPLYAEVFGWQSKTVIKKNAEGKKVKTTVAVPIIGMEGNKSRSGAHVTEGLRKQGNAPPVDMAGKSAEPILTAAPPKPGKNAKDNEPVKKTKLLRHKVVAKKYKSKAASTGAGPLPVVKSITTTEQIDGYRYRPPLKTMHPNALAAVEVDAYVVGSSTSTTVKKNYTFSFEQIARPPWLSDIYFNQNIGPKFYQELFRCGSIVDFGAIATPHRKVPEDTLVDVGSDRPLTYAEAEALKKGYGSDFSYKEGVKLLDEGHIQSIIEDFSNDVDKSASEVKVISYSRPEDEKDRGVAIDIPISALGGVSVANATDNLAAAYDVAREDGTYMARFIDDYTHRKVADMTDIFGYGWRPGKINGHDGNNESGKPDGGVLGTYSVEVFSQYDPEGKFKAEHPNMIGSKVKVPLGDLSEVLVGAPLKEGFHSAAFGKLDNLALLPHEPLADIMNRAKRPLDPRVDPRKERYDRIQKYKDSLGFKAST